ncbi:putative ATP-grasp-modified RiPP [Streptomyces albidochromogenes]|uniref:putative ATP-grasp-modified RiPP n=1 Tax=Streptomyces albidochromogenes TaxID=329524 RepID=UPI00110FA7DC|nr:putative ATP-grasp-modified RiPP [Streptomyces albidochromogenes]
MRPFVLNYAQQNAVPDVPVPYDYSSALQLNLLPDGRPAISDRVLLLAVGTTTSTAGSQTHFDD